MGRGPYRFEPASVAVALGLEFFNQITRPLRFNPCLSVCLCVCLCVCGFVCPSGRWRIVFGGFFSGGPRNELPRQLWCALQLLLQSWTKVQFWYSDFFFFFFKLQFWTSTLNFGSIFLAPKACGWLLFYWGPHYWHGFTVKFDLNVQKGGSNGLFFWPRIFQLDFSRYCTSGIPAWISLYCTTFDTMVL